MHTKKKKKKKQIRFCQDCEWSSYACFYSKKELRSVIKLLMSHITQESVKMHILVDHYSCKLMTIRTRNTTRI